jgi:hypothetical protein
MRNGCDCVRWRLISCTWRLKPQLYKQNLPTQVTKSSPRLTPTRRSFFANADARKLATAIVPTLRRYGSRELTSKRALKRATALKRAALTAPVDFPLVRVVRPSRALSVADARFACYRYAKVFPQHSVIGGLGMQ